MDNAERALYAVLIAQARGGQLDRRFSSSDGVVTARLAPNRTKLWIDIGGNARARINDLVTTIAGMAGNARQSPSPRPDRVVIEVRL